MQSMLVSVYSYAFLFRFRLKVLRANIARYYDVLTKRKIKCKSYRKKFVNVLSYIMSEIKEFKNKALNSKTSNICEEQTMIITQLFLFAFSCATKTSFFLFVFEF